MTTPEQPAHSQPTEATPLVTILRDMDTITITGLAEEPAERTHSWDDPEIAKEVKERLLTLYMTLGQGVSTLEQVKTATGLDGRQIAGIGMQLARVLPEEVFSHQGKRSRSTFTFGNFGVASRQVTEEERAAVHAAQEAKVKDAFADKKNAVHAAEAGKTDFSEADHALIRTGNDEYYMPINGTAGIAAIRALQAIKIFYQTPENCMLRVSELTKAMWASMPLAERRLFTDSEKRLYGTGIDVLAKHTRRFIHAVASPMGIAHRAGVESAFKLGDDPDFTVEVKPEPPEEPYDPKRVGSVYPPGTEKALVQAGDLGEARPEEVEAILAVLDKVFSGQEFTHDDAINIIDILTDRRSKTLARRILAQEFGAGDPYAALADLDKRSVATLGWSSYDLHRSTRTIKGNKGASRVQQVSGNLPGRTFKYMGEADERDLTQKWTFVNRTR